MIEHTKHTEQKTIEINFTHLLTVLFSFIYPLSIFNVVFVHFYHVPSHSEHKYTLNREKITNKWKCIIKMKYKNGFYFSFCYEIDMVGSRYVLYNILNMVNWKFDNSCPLHKLIEMNNGKKNPFADKINCINI